MAKDGASIRKIAAAFGVHPRTIWSRFADMLRVIRKEIAPKLRERKNQQKKERRQFLRVIHREHIRERQRRWRKTRPRGEWWINQSAYGRAWLKNNPEKRLEYSRRNNERRRAILEERIRGNLSSRLYRVLLSKCSRKSSKITQVLGCDVLWLKAWLEVQFQPGMTWEKYGCGWHIDHIRPCASFDLSDPAQQKLYFHWTNLQPLWASDNLQKNAKWVDRKE